MLSATVRGAQAEFTKVAKQLESQHPERNPFSSRLIPLEQYVSGRVRPALFVLACAVGVVITGRVARSHPFAHVRTGGFTARIGHGGVPSIVEYASRIDPMVALRSN